MPITSKSLPTVDIPLSLSGMYSITDAAKTFGISLATLRDHTYTQQRQRVSPVRLGVRLNTVHKRRFATTITYDVVIYTERMMILLSKWQPGMPIITPNEEELAQIMNTRRVAGYLVDNGYSPKSPVESLKKAIAAGNFNAPRTKIGRHWIYLRRDVDEHMSELLAHTYSRHEARTEPTKEERREMQRLRFTLALSISEIKEQYPQFSTEVISQVVTTAQPDFMQSGGLHHA